MIDDCTEKQTAASCVTRIEPEPVAYAPSSQRLIEVARRVAASDCTVLIVGESGTGKEVLARFIHRRSPRAAQPFVAVNCAAIPENMLEAMLFGYERGSFTGAQAAHPGKFEQAQGGTLLLDEIGELPFDLQVSLARGIAQYSLPSSNSQDTKPSAARKNARLICTTSHDLQALTHSGAFFRDLLEQINILPIEIPPLGRRREDIPLLVSHFLEQATEAGGEKKIYSPKAIEVLATADWPGNVRQLFELVKQHVALSRGKLMSKEFVQQSLGPQPPSMLAYDEARDQFSHDFLAANLQRAGGNVTKAARLAKRSRTDFYKLLGRFRVQAHDFKEGGVQGTEGEEEDDQSRSMPNREAE